jgi:hypothetical protein
MSDGPWCEVSFNGTNQFNSKISSGNGMQLISRDFHRLVRGSL